MAFRRGAEAPRYSEEQKTRAFPQPVKPRPICPSFTDELKSIRFKTDPCSSV
jgi:hypothetical protein